MNELLRNWLNLPPQASTYAFQVDALHYAVIAVTMFGAAYVFFLALYFLARYRLRVLHETTVNTETGLRLEAFIVVSILSLFLIFWAIGATQYNRIMTPPANAMQIYVTGKQWMWAFSYSDGRASLDVLTVPAHRPVKLVMTSRDVIHSFYVPAFRMKHDVVPGRYTMAWFEATSPGTYDIECAEFCGVGHSHMLGTVRVLTTRDYARWLDEPRIATQGEGGTTLSDLAVEGREIAARRACFNCHTEDGQPHIGPSWAGLYGSTVRLTDGTTLLADAEYLTRSMMDPQVEVVDGYKPVMPTYRGVLEQPELAALLEFMRSIRNEHPAASVRLPKVTSETPAQPQEPRR